MPAAVRAKDFVESIGVNVHVEYTDGKYANAANVVKDLAYLGVDQVRDASLNVNNEGQDSYGVLANAGIKFDMMLEGTSITSSLKLLDSFVAAHPGSISAIEGLNEINNWPITYNGLTGNAAGVAYQNALYSAVKADASLSKLPVFNLTNDTSLAAKADFANVHAYPWAGAQAYATLKEALQTQTSAMAGKPAVLTEAGYYTLPNDTSSWGGVDYATQAKLTLNLLMDSIKLGMKQTYLYELLDAYADPSGADPEKHFGLFDINNNPKPVATALHNLTTLLADTGATATSFTPGTLNYTISGLPSTASSLLIQKSSGVYEIVIWNEPTIWNDATHKAIAAAATTATVSFGATAATVSVFDPLVDVTAKAALSSVGQVTVSLTDHPIVVEVNLSAATATATATTTVSSVDVLNARAGGDTLTGTAADEHLNGASGADVLSGGAGSDTLTPGAGADTLTGGAGADLFVFRSTTDTGVGASGDVITDFRASDGDHIDLHGIQAQLATGVALHWVDRAGFSHTAGEVHWYRETGGVALSGDLNGDGTAEFTLHLRGLSSLSGSSLVF